MSSAAPACHPAVLRKRYAGAALDIPYGGRRPVNSRRRRCRSAADEKAVCRAAFFDDRNSNGSAAARAPPNERVFRSVGVRADVDVAAFHVNANKRTRVVRIRLSVWLRRHFEPSWFDGLFTSSLHAAGNECGGLSEGGDVNGQEEFVVRFQRLAVDDVQLAVVVRC